MRAREVVLASLFIVIALLSGLVATTAGGQSVRYKGTLDTFYVDPYVKIVESYWRVRILEDGKAIFFLKWIELNIEEEVPGTYDYFIVWMRTDNVTLTGDGCVISGTSYWWKNKVLTYIWDTEITISETNYWTQFCMYINGTWFMDGSLLP